MPISDDQIRAAAAAIANARGARRGAPFVTNILDVLPIHLRSEVMEDAGAALRAIFGDGPAGADLRLALEESVKLQSHYAKQLNGWDEGKRVGFKSGDEWIARLRQTGKLLQEAQ